MDLVAWLWERVERRDASALLAHALNTPGIRDALLREAAIRDGWTPLAHAAEDAADVSGEVNWSRHSPDAVAAICHWILAERTLRRIPTYDLTAPIAQAALAAWANPEVVADRLAASSPISAEDAAGFEDAIRSEAASASHAGLLDELAARVGGDPAFAASALNDPSVARVLLQRAARRGDWGSLARAAERAVASGHSNVASDAGAARVGEICGWMLGEAASPDARWTHPHEVAQALAATSELSDLDVEAVRTRLAGEQA